MNIDRMYARHYPPALGGETPIAVLDAIRGHVLALAPQSTLRERYTSIRQGIANATEDVLSGVYGTSGDSSYLDEDRPLADARYLRAAVEELYAEIGKPPANREELRAALAVERQQRDKRRARAAIAKAKGDQS